MIKLSNDIFAILLKTVWFILVALVVYFIYTGEYFLVLIFSFPILGWGLNSKLFRVKSVSFNKKDIFIGSKKFDLAQIEEIESHVLRNSFVKIKGRKYYFIAPLNDHGLENNLEKLKMFIENRENEIIDSTAYNNG